MAQNDEKMKLTEADAGQLGFAMSRLTNLFTHPFFASFAKEFDLNLTEWRTLYVLDKNPDIASREVSFLSGIHVMSISRAVHGLRNKGYITETVDPDDRRRVRLNLTSSGQSVCSQIRDHADARAVRLFEVLTPEEFEALWRIEKKLTKRAIELTMGAGKAPRTQT